MYNGIINVYKERGYTSHDVVAKLRGISGQKKIGHTGTLDPEAEGVLPVCFGRATKVCELLTDRAKTYEAVLLLGKETDTQDTTGTILKECEVTATEAQILDVVASFRGDILQVPPMYSALKHNGKKLYELAREGKVIERKARPVTIFSLNVLSMNLPYITMEITCSKGTYIRTLCHDIGQALGCGGCMAKLCRTRVGEFSLDFALRLSQLQEAKDQGRFADCLLSTDQLFLEYPKYCFTPEATTRADNGNALFLSDFSKTPQVEEEPLLRVYNSNDLFYGIYELESEKLSYRPKKLLKEM